MITLSQRMIDALNDQINNEFYGSYSYLALIAYFESQNLAGFAHWMELQRQEEHEHAMRLFNLLMDHNSTPVLQSIEQPKNEFESPIEAFRFVLEHEQHVTQRILNLYEIAIDEKAYSIKIDLDWFVTEQVEEEKISRTIFEQLQLVGDDKAALLVLDRELAQRTPDSDGK